jgi:hypothetical protein
LYAVALTTEDAAKQHHRADQIALLADIASEPDTDRYAQDQRRAIDREAPARFVAGHAEAAGDIGQAKIDAVGGIEFHSRRKAEAQQQHVEVLRREGRHRRHAGRSVNYR